MEDATRSAQKAIDYEKAGRYDAAVYFYCDAARTLLELLRTGKAPPKFKETAESYILRAETIKARSASKLSSNIKSQHQQNLERAEFLLYQALDSDKADDAEEAVELYSQAVELCLQTQAQCSVDIRRKLSDIAKRALERVEVLKAQQLKMVCKHETLSLPNVSDELTNLKLDGRNSRTANIRSSSPLSQTKLRRSDRFDKEELAVLASTSDINGRVYVPFLSVDLKERFGYPVPFSDRHGLLPLDEKQKKRLKAWMRPDEIMHSPTVIEGVDSGTIKQTIVSDCSFIASLAISARYERRFGKRLVTSVIFPQNKQGIPVYNPCGKYMIKLHINGCWRKNFGFSNVGTELDWNQWLSQSVPTTYDCLPSRLRPVILFGTVLGIFWPFQFGSVVGTVETAKISSEVVIDDRFPVGEHGEFLCSYSQKGNELWVSLLEKAYMKVMGGYDFPGSNSSIDMNALTGWIPERIALKKDSSSVEADKIFEKLFTRSHQGQCLITLATGNLDQLEAERAGLVDCHAYAVLDLRKVQGKRLLLVKNPWTHLRWKGRYSEKDSVNWTPELCKALDYSPTDAQQFDDGVFWIDYESVCHFFDVFYVNWDPSIFLHSYCLHSTWSADKGPVKDLYTVSENPQYTLEVYNKTSSSAVWILLTRHITDKADFANNKEFIAVFVYKSGKKIYLRSDPKLIMDPIRINSPHFLGQFVVTEPGIQSYTLVVAQYEKMKTIHYTLRVYSSADFKLQKVNVPYVVKKKECGEWKGKTAGGCGNGLSRETYRNNPVYHISLDDGSDDNDLLIDLKGPKQFSVGFDFLQISSPRNKPFEKKDSGAFRPGYTILTLEAVPAGVYSVQPMTFFQGQEGPFFLTVEASCGFAMKRVQ